jgi:hypothetical protein
MSNQYLQFDICAQALTAKEGHLDVTQLSDSGIGIKPEESRVKNAIAKGYGLIQC